MKQCALIHINDGNPVTLTNGDRYFAEAFPRVETAIEELLNQGYEVRQILPDVSPAKQHEDCYSFYKTGFVIYLEREIPDGEEPEDNGEGYPADPDAFTDVPEDWDGEDFAEFDFSEDNDMAAFDPEAPTFDRDDVE